MKFGNLENLIYFIFPIFMVIILIMGLKKKNRGLKLLNLSNNKKISYLKIFFISVGTILVCISLLSPEKFLEEQNVERKGNSIYVLIDTSRSMLTKDVYPNRIEGAKRVTKEIIKNLKGDKIGIIPFSDSAYIQMPLTDDYTIAENYINVIDTNLITGGGTNIYEGLVIANNSFNEIESDNKIVLVISDGGDYDKKVLDFIKYNKIIVYTVGIGTSKGAVIPDNQTTGFIKDEKGNVVVSQLNSDFLKEMSNNSKGKYYEVNNLQNNTLEFLKEINSLEKNNIKNEKLAIYEKYYQIFLGFGLIFILLGYFLKGRVSYEK
ncbi:MAG: VWA domain-containing protein [Fusobacterium perfoetens]|uniref:vWA domain-containing protein n=1 Tax=Fusobacterium perfoetens TaxID=852 RepID=UPI0023F2374F|nr:VWA domain-containing protein [Fusobacterium perfoetens]MCI6152415.1 VWA domain-containing protein [Fusobacterium perfoetens]MDY3237014.1 VWA domain-containing protein [Fusobacterium perfoetens]